MRAHHWSSGWLEAPVLEERPVHLSPGDTEKLLLSVAGMVARDRLGRGVRLNRPEAVALLSTWVIERARDGASVAELMEAGREVLGPDDVMPGVAETLHDVQVEATFPDGRKLVTLHDPVGAAHDGTGPGAVAVGEGTVRLNEGRTTITLVVENTGDRPVQLGSHLHLPDANGALDLDREAATGFRLDIPAGTSMRFEPGASREVTAVALGGARRVPGVRLRTTGDDTDGTREA
jgi:urease subunit gamma/beta